MFLIFPNLSLHSAMRIIKYLIINDADENIFLTAFPNNTLRERRFIKYYEGGIEWDIVPVMWQEYIKDPISTDIGPKFLAPVMSIMPLLEDIEVDGAEIIQGFFDEFTIHDTEGDIIITLDDLQRGSDFEKYKETEDLFVFLVTRDIIRTGRKKHLGEKTKDIIVPFEVGVPDVDIPPRGHMMQIENPITNQLQSQYAFTDKDNNYQIRYTFFKEIKDDCEKSIEDRRRSFMVFVSQIYDSLTGNGPFTRFGIVNKAIESSRNFDYLLLFWLEDEESKRNFCGSYEYIRIVSYYKVGKGVLVQVYLFNNIESAFTPERLEALEAFVFHDS
jgi:hypothetical protein